MKKPGRAGGGPGWGRSGLVEGWALGVRSDRGRKFLRGRGYRDGTPEFDRLLATHIWQDGHRTTANFGIWFTDLFEATSAIERATRMASRRPPSNIYSIANSCPAPKS